MPSHRRVLLIAALAALAGAAASLLFEPRIAYRLASTEVGQEALQATLEARAPPLPAGVIVARRGERVPALALPDLDGAAIQLPAAWAGRTTLVNFWATWCAPCLKEMPDLQAYSAQQGATGVRVVGIALDAPEAVRPFLLQHAITYPILTDSPGPADAGVRLGNRAGVLPFSALIDADGRLIKTKIGPFEDEAAIAAWASAPH
ncbi:TlpA disulfide reductase family protein [Thermomonas sp.]|uniref:TlpA family protein disulfide reductase n=1 Tax=Thermomonas sp. TaxID=1971895 RepID=UPI00261E2AF5|nr:TlpA disulfide reductase family protein [Thermomonas sp.]MCO5055140.1 TlpA family protein disulfide reductase [Thermomonas sp.]